MKLLLTVLMLLWPSQAEASGNEVKIGVVSPEGIEGVEDRAFSVLNTKMKSMCAEYGVSSSAMATFVMYPTIGIVDTKLIEGGLKNFYAITIDVGFFIKEIPSGTEFGHLSKELRGSGDSVTNAAIDAFRSINVQDKEYGIFLSKAKERIVQYYTTNLSKLLTTAETLASGQQYEQALALLMAYPDEIEGSDKVVSEAMEIYKAYQNSICKETMLKATVAFVAQDYDEAVHLLAGINPESECNADAMKLLRSIQDAVENLRKEENDRIKDLIEKEYSLEKSQIDAMKEVATAFAENQPQITYAGLLAL